MKETQLTIPKHPLLKPAEDYYRLRREGIGFLEQMGSQQWTDYNQHDPGITILEALCFAITDLAYRTGWNIRDLLTPKTMTDPDDPYPAQAFFTARNILTNNPCTPDDFRRLLIDLTAVRNAWVYCKQCACDLSYYAWCEENKVKMAATRPTNPLLHPREIKPLGLYDILLELESDPALGDLNNRKMEERFFVYEEGGKPQQIILELRFPEWKLEQDQAWDVFLGAGDMTIEVLKFNRTDDKTVTIDITDTELRRHWQNLFYTGFKLTMAGGETITIDNVSVRLFGNTTAKNIIRTAAIKERLGADTANGTVQRYRSKLQKIKSAVDEAKAALHSHRNLNEDYCRISHVKIEDIAVCADVEVAPEADIEKVQAQIWYEITQYLNPPVRFYSLQELMGNFIQNSPNEPSAQNTTLPVEEIFNGPGLEHGFLKTDELQASGLKTVLYTSDIINRLMDIEGVRAVNNLLLSKYDQQGRMVYGAADPTFSHTDPQTPIFDATKGSAAWVLHLEPQHQPRLYFNLSRFLFYKNGLPFLPRMDEATDTFKIISGETERPKLKKTINDLSIPIGTYKAADDYFPVQYSLPKTYGIGTDGLPSHATPVRRAQASQLKAYLMVYEQILANAHAQLAHAGDLFSLDPAVKQTFFTRLLDDTFIQGYSDVVNGLTETLLQQMVEGEEIFVQRRNRFLDHLLARFGESFTEYALLLTNFSGERVVRRQLIETKISFLKAYPAISHDRGKAFNAYHHLSAPGNVAGLKKRIGLLLGYPDLSFTFSLQDSEGGGSVIVAFQIRDSFANTIFEGSVTTTASHDGAGVVVYRQVLRQLIRADEYTVQPSGEQFRLQLRDADGNELGFALKPTAEEAKTLQTNLLQWSSYERSVVVEHLLLRPKFPGDALFDLCETDDCTCEDDPWSFRLTLVMPGWTEPFNVNLDMRQFANRTIQEETPSHLMVKTCWVGNDGFVRNACDEVVTDLAGILEKNGLTEAGERPTGKDACDSALTLYHAFSDVFEDWYKDKAKGFLQADALQAELKTMFDGAVDPATFSFSTVLTPTLWKTITALVEKHFSNIALYGYQFERFEDAWYAWLEANQPFDWTEERLQERIEAALLNNVQGLPSAVQKAALCNCATSILMAFGIGFYNWMDGNLKEGRALADFTPFTPDAVQLCTGFTFNEGTKEIVETLLARHFNRYTEVSYRLRVVVHLLGRLRNTYPGATLHDCDDGSDQNPVRLNNTALGNYPLHRSGSTPPET